MKGLLNALKLQDLDLKVSKTGQEQMWEINTTSRETVGLVFDRDPCCIQPIATIASCKRFKCNTTTHLFDLQEGKFMRIRILLEVLKPLGTIAMGLWKNH